MSMIDGRVLYDIKHALGLELDDPAFDMDLKIHINSALGNIVEVGVGDNTFRVITGEELWSDFLCGGAAELLEFDRVKSYVYIMTKAIFDPTSAANNQHMITFANELLQRLCYAAEHLTYNTSGETNCGDAGSNATSSSTTCTSGGCW